jgi:very-short-patch-repair endonuclease
VKGPQSQALRRVQIPPPAPHEPYLADLCYIKQRPIVELDGGHHAEQQKQEATRTVYLTEQSYCVIGFWNEQVNRDIDHVLEAIYAALADS